MVCFHQQNMIARTVNCFSPCRPYGQYFAHGIIKTMRVTLPQPIPGAAVHWEGLQSGWSSSTDTIPHHICSMGLLLCGDSILWLMEDRLHVHRQFLKESFPCTCPLASNRVCDWIRCFCKLELLSLPWGPQRTACTFSGVKLCCFFSMLCAGSEHAGRGATQKSSEKTASTGTNPGQA